MIKCARTVCKKRSADPKADGWTWFEFDPPPPTTGWWCPDCTAHVKAILAEHGGTPTVEPLN
jgi:hypothetical protein